MSGLALVSDERMVAFLGRWCQGALLTGADGVSQGWDVYA